MLWGIRLLEGPQRRRWPSRLGGRGRTAPLVLRERVAPKLLLHQWRRWHGCRPSAWALGPSSPRLPTCFRLGPAVPQIPGHSPRDPGPLGFTGVCFLSSPASPGPAWSWWSGAGSWAPEVPPHMLPTWPRALSCGQRSQRWAMGHPHGALDSGCFSLYPWGCGEFPVRLGCGPCRGQTGAQGSCHPG